nr:zinc finger, CCHC-type, retrotransposon Gag domain protein [Tanacetum cinerariifolium]
MLVEVGKFTFPVDFVILDMEVDSKVPLILGRPFLHTVDAVIRVKQKQLNLVVGTERMIFNIDSAMKHSYSNDDTCFSIDVIDEILEEDFDALLDEGRKILHSIEGTLLEEEIFFEFDEFMAMAADENSESESDIEELPFNKITINTDYKIKRSLEEPPTDLELKPLPDNLEYVFLEEPSFLPVTISSQLSAKNKSKLISVLKNIKKPSLGKRQTFLEKCLFMVKEGIVPGHKVSSVGLKVDKAKINIISKLPSPTNIKGDGRNSGGKRLAISMVDEAWLSGKEETLLPQIRAEIREEFRTSSGPSDSGGNPPPVTIHTWLECFNKQKPIHLGRRQLPWTRRIRSLTLRRSLMSWVVRMHSRLDWLCTSLRVMHLLGGKPISKPKVVMHGAFEREYHSIRQTNTKTSTEFMQHFLRLAGFLGAAAGTEEEQAKNFYRGLRKSTLNHLMCTPFTDVAQVANAARRRVVIGISRPLNRVVTGTTVIIMTVMDQTEIREEFRTSSGPSDAGGNHPPLTIHTWLERFNKQKPHSFEKATAPVDAENWISHMEKIFDVIGCEDAFKTRLAVYKFEGNALAWWKAYKQAKCGDAWLITTNTETSMDLMQRFLRLAGFLRAAAGTEEEQAKNFHWGLRRNFGNGRDQRYMGQQSNRSANSGSLGLRRFFRYAMFIYSCYLCYVLSLYPFTERYAQPYFFSYLIRQHMKSLRESILERAKHKRENDKRVNDRTMQSKEGKVASSKALDVGLIVIECSGTNEMTEKLFAEYTGIKVKQFRETLLLHIGNVKKSVAKKTRHKRQYDKRMKERLMHSRESKVVLSKALDASLVVTECSGTKSDEHITSNSSGTHITQVVDADIRPVNAQVLSAEVYLTAPHNVFANEQQHTDQSEPSYDTYLLEKGDSNTTLDLINMSHRGREIDQDAEQDQVKSPLLKAEFLKTNDMVEKEVYNELSNRFNNLRNIVFDLKFQYNKKKKVFKVTNHVNYRAKVQSPKSRNNIKPTKRIPNVNKHEGCISKAYRWIPTGKMFIDCTTKLDREPLNGSNDDITNPYECDQTLNVSAVSVAVAAPRAVDPVGSPLSTIIDQDVPSASTSLTIQKIQSQVTHQDPSPEETTLQGFIPSNLHHLNQSFNSLTKLTKNHPLENVIGDLS